MTRRLHETAESRPSSGTRGFGAAAVQERALATLGLTVSFVGCGASGDDRVAPDGLDRGPLALVPFDNGMEALSRGTVRITETCVILEEAGGPSLLVWHASRTSWNPAAREVVFVNRDGRTITLRDGSHVTFSGGGASTAEGGLPGARWIEETTWVSRPDAACPSDSRWFVNEIVAAS